MSCCVSTQSTSQPYLNEVPCLSDNSRAKPFPTWQEGLCLVSRLIAPCLLHSLARLNESGRSNAMQCNVRHDTTQQGESPRGNSPVMRMKISNPFSPVGSLHLLDTSQQRERGKKRKGSKTRPGPRSNRRLHSTSTSTSKANQSINDRPGPWKQL